MVKSSWRKKTLFQSMFTCNSFLVVRFKLEKLWRNHGFKLLKKNLIRMSSVLY